MTDIFDRFNVLNINLHESTQPKPYFMLLIKLVLSRESQIYLLNLLNELSDSSN